MSAAPARKFGQPSPLYERKPDPAPASSDMSASRPQTNLLLQAGQLLLEYNESTGAIHRALLATARALTDEPCHVMVTYRGVAVSLGEEPPGMRPVRAITTRPQARPRVLGQVRRGELDAVAAAACLERVEADTPRPPAGWSPRPSARRRRPGVPAGRGRGRSDDRRPGNWIGRSPGWNSAPTMLPADCRWPPPSWCSPRRPGNPFGLDPDAGTRLVVPAPHGGAGPHFINRLLDLIDNCLPLAWRWDWRMHPVRQRGIVLGVELTLGPLRQPAARPDRLNLTPKWS